MILVEVTVPTLNRKYDFELDETVKIGLLTDEILEMLCRREKREMPARTDAFCLSELSLGTILDPEGTLQDYGVKDGGQLILT